MEGSRYDGGVAQMKAAFAMTWRGLWRGKTLWTLLAAVFAAHFLLPGIARSDGTPAGMCEMHLRVVFGAVAALVYVSALALACGSFARDREDDLLPLSLVRPASALSVAAGRWLAFTLLMALALCANAILANAILPRTGYAPGNCRTHHVPALPPAEVTAAAMMERFLASDNTPDEVKKAPRAAVLALLTAKERERYEVVRPGKTLTLPFAKVPSGRLAAKVRFSTMYNIQEPLTGTFRFRDLEGTVSNTTQAVLEVPLTARMPDLSAGPAAFFPPVSAELEFMNAGRTDVMLRPRRDVELLSPGDSFLANSLRATLEMLSVAGLFVAFGLFLSAALSRPVALFTAAVLLAAALMAPDAVSQFPDEFNATAGEKAGLAISRAVTRFTAALSELSPVSDLATGRAIGWGETLRALGANLVAWPALFLGLAAFILRRKVK